MQTPKRITDNRDPFVCYDQKCACQICTCGKHHCPPKNVTFVGETTNHQDYRAYHITPQRYQPCRFEVQQRHYDPNVLKTSYNHDYEAYKIQPQQNPVRYEYTQKKTPFYGETEYKKSYVPLQINPQRPATCANIDYRNKAKFDGTTTYQVEFSPKKVEKVSYSPVKYERKQIPFQGQSIYHSEYKPHKIQISKPMTAFHPEDYQGRRNKFMGESRYKQEYKPYEIEKPQVCPVSVMPQMPRTCSPGKQHLRYSAEKHRWE